MYRWQFACSGSWPLCQTSVSWSQRTLTTSPDRSRPPGPNRPSSPPNLRGALGPWVLPVRPSPGRAAPPPSVSNGWDAEDWVSGNDSHGNRCVQMSSHTNQEFNYVYSFSIHCLVVSQRSRLRLRHHLPKDHFLLLAWRGRRRSRRERAAALQDPSLHWAVGISWEYGSSFIKHGSLFW